MKKTLFMTMVIALALALASLASAETVLTSATLKGEEEVPAISTVGQGLFLGVIDTDANAIQYTLIYGSLEGNVAQAHIHLGQTSVNGGIMLFLCTNLGNGPPGTPACGPSGVVTGTLTAASVVGPSGQGVAAMEMAEAIRAIRRGVAYANVHSSLHGGGEIRGQIR
ncbi:MAG: CHRD domain-containing protein [Vicinamibacteria bacterium]